MTKKLPVNWKNRSREHKARWFAQGQCGARRGGHFNGEDFVEVWYPTVRGQIVCCPTSGQSKLEDRPDALAAAVRFRELCQDISKRRA